MIRLSLALAMGALSVLVQAQAPQPAQPGDAAAQLSAQREALAQQRSQAQDRFNAEQAACRNRFLASPCLSDAEARHRTELAPLRQQEIALDRAERERKTVLQQERAAQKKEAHEASRQAAPLTTSTPTPTPSPGRSMKSLPNGAEQTEQARQRQAQRETRQAAKKAQAQSREDEAEQRARKTQERQARAERYRQEQQSRPAKPMSAPLPLPAAPQ